MLSILRKPGASIADGPRAIPGLRVESSAQGLSIHSDVGMDRVSLVSITGQETVVGNGREVRILPGRFHTGLYILRAASEGAVETRKVLLER